MQFVTFGWDSVDILIDIDDISTRKYINRAKYQGVYNLDSPYLYSIYIAIQCCDNLQCVFFFR